MNANSIDGYVDTSNLLKLIDRIESEGAQSVKNAEDVKVEPRAMQLPAEPPQHAALLRSVGRYVNIWA